MELLVKLEILTSYMYGPTFGNAEAVSFYLLHNVSTLNQCRKFSCVTVCVNTLSATKITLITDGIYFGSLRFNEVSYSGNASNNKEL
jgi:hypothetical protein